MAAAGVDVATFHTEYGYGQFEMALAPKFGIDAADQMFILKGAVKEMTRQHNGWLATFMSKPFASSDSNGLHYSHSLWTLPSSSSGEKGSECTNVFSDPTSDNGLSNVARYWMAGLVKHGRALMALCSPSVNCYRRLGTIMTPNYVNWGIGYRSASFCAKTGSPSATYFENRLPGGVANPYLVMAATIAAGIDGIVNKLECPAPTTMAADEHKPSAESNGAQQIQQQLPKSLSESLEALENDGVLCEALGKEFVSWFVKAKRANEIAKVAKAFESGQTDFEVERDLYFKFL